jgi:Rad3-related DNA helicase
MSGDSIYNELCNCFPKTTSITEMRDVQRLGLVQIADAISKGHKLIVLAAPTGSGKSAIGITIARFFERKGLKTTYTSPLNSLVTQMQDTMGMYISTIKGREHYTCNIGNLQGKHIKCSEGYCRSRICGTALLRREHKAMNCKNCEDSNLNKCKCVECSFKIDMNKYKQAPIGNTNFSLFQMNIRQQRVAIIDECEALEQGIRSHVGLTIHENWPAGLKWIQYLEMLNEYCAELRQDTLRLGKELEEGFMLDDRQRKLYTKELEKKTRDIEKVMRINEDWSINKTEWIPVFEENSRGKSVKFEPITVDRFIDEMFEEDDYVFFMSATPIVPAGWKLIELESPFPKEIRPWTFIKCGPMSMDSKCESYKKLAQFIVDLQVKRPGKILVHCNSYSHASCINEELKNLGCTHTILQTKSDSVMEFDGSENLNRNAALAKFKAHPNMNTIFLSVNMTSGVDLAATSGVEYVATQIIAKIPFPVPTDPIIMKKRELYGKIAEAQFNQEIANIMMQAYGRINRNAEKHTLTIITDSNFLKWFSENRRYFKKYFLEAKIDESQIVY